MRLKFDETTPLPFFRKGTIFISFHTHPNLLPPEIVSQFRNGKKRAEGCGPVSPGDGTCKQHYAFISRLTSIYDIHVYLAAISMLPKE